MRKKEKQFLRPLRETSIKTPQPQLHCNPTLTPTSTSTHLNPPRTQLTSTSPHLEPNPTQLTSPAESGKKSKRLGFGRYESLWESRIGMDRSYHGENRPSHQHWARKHHWARSVVRWGTTCEPLVTICQSTFWPLLSPCCTRETLCWARAHKGGVRGGR